MSDDLAADLAWALRLGRHRERLSQRATAELTGVSKSLVSRVELGELPAGVRDVERLMSRLGFALQVSDVSVPEEWPGWSPFPSDQRDVAGRRFPAHSQTYPRQIPHTWWFVRHVTAPLSEWPVWTWRRSDDLDWFRSVHPLPVEATQHHDERGERLNGREHPLAQSQRRSARDEVGNDDQDEHSHPDRE